MKKIIISQEEKDRILESHNSYREDLMGHLFDKNLIKEQQSFTAPEANPQGYTEPSKVLKDAQTKCTQGSPLTKGNIVPVTGAGDAIKYKHEGDDQKVGASSGDTTYYFGNFTYQTVAPNNQIKTGPKADLEASRQNLQNRQNVKYFSGEEPYADYDSASTPSTQPSGTSSTEGPTAEY